jgi:hypothetical protein
MKSMLSGLIGAAMVLAMAMPAPAADTEAKDTKDLKKAIADQEINFVETAPKGITLSGYVDVSYTNQFAGRGQEFASIDNERNSQSTLRAFDHNANGFNVQAVKIALEKSLPDKNDWAAGFRIDTILGADSTYLGDTAFNGFEFHDFYGNNNSGLALEQALVKFRIPVGNGLDVYAGKFVSFLGYEVIESPANLNFSRGLLFTNAIPHTTTGVYADYHFNDLVEAKLGVVDGWNDSQSTVSGDPAAAYAFGGKAITGQVNVTNPGHNANLCQSFIYSPDSRESVSSRINLSGDNGPAVVYDVWGNWNPTFVKDSALTLGFNIDLGWSGAAGLVHNPNTTISFAQSEHEDTNTWWGAALYASYRLNRIVTLSGRGEYLHTDSVEANNPKYGYGFEVSEGNFLPASQDDFSYTLTTSFNIWDNLLTRVEYRVDVLQGTTVFPQFSGDFPSIGGTALAQHSTVENEVSLEVVYSF